LHPSGVALSSTSFGWGKGGNVTSAGWQVILCDPIWHVSSRSGEASRELLYSVYFTLLLREAFLLCQGCVTGTSRATFVERMDCTVFAGSAASVMTLTCATTATCPANMTCRTHSSDTILLSQSGINQTWNWVIGSPGQWVIWAIFHVRVILTRCARPEFFRFSKKCPKCRTYIWNAEMTKVRCLLLDWNHWMSVHALNFYFYLWLLKILWVDSHTPTHKSTLEFIVEQGHRINWVSGSLDSRVIGSLDHKMWPSSMPVFMLIIVIYVKLS